MGIEAHETDPITVHSNPTAGRYLIEVPGPARMMRLEVRDALGRVITRSTCTGPLVEVDLSNWSDGIFLIAVADDQEVFTTRLIKKH